MEPYQTSRRDLIRLGGAVAAALALDAVAAPATEPASQPANAPDDGSIIWRDVREWGVEGRGWNDTAAYFDRLPARAKGVVRNAVWDLGHQTAGMCVFFTTDSPTIRARYALTSATLAMAHMPATGVSGLDLYARDSRGWHWFDVTKPAKQSGVATLGKGSTAGRRDYLMYLPLYNGLTSLEIGVERGAVFTPVPPRTQRPVVYYGTSIAQGGCASRPGMAHVAQIGRMIDRPMINLGFSGNGWMDLELVSFLAELDAAAFVIDCLPNCTLERIKKNAKPFIEKLLAVRPNTPIVLVDDPPWCHARWSQSLTTTQVERRTAYREIFDGLSTAAPNLHYLSGERFFGDDGEGTVDGVHPNDLGMYRMAQVMAPVIREVTAGR